MNCAVAFGGRLSLSVPIAESRWPRAAQRNPTVLADLGNHARFWGAPAEHLPAGGESLRVRCKINSRAGPVRGQPHQSSEPKARGRGRLLWAGGAPRPRPPAYELILQHILKEFDHWVIGLDLSASAGSAD